MSEDELPVLDTFSAVLLEEYLRLMTAAFYIKSETKTGSIKFKIKPEYYQQIQASPIQAPLIGLTLDYDEAQEILTITGNEKFIQMYENKIQEEVALNFELVNKKRYSKFISLV